MSNPSIFAAFERMWQHVLALVGGKANIDHTHDDLYYTEAEIDNALESKANTNHTHDDLYYTEAEVDAKIDEVAAIVNDIEAITNSEIDTLFESEE